MSAGIFLLSDENTLVPMTEQPYDTEDILQSLLARFPDLLAGDQLPGATPRRWLLIGREASLPSDEDGAGRWSVDHLFLDQDAIPTLVEVKRSSDTRIRREVVGQMLDYAANAVVYWPIERLRSVYERRCQAAGLDPDAELRRAVLEPDGEPDNYWEQAGANLKAGRLRLVFVADDIPHELRRVVEFLNEQMTADVLAIEVKQYVGEGLRTLVPRVIGQTAAAETKNARSGAGPGKQWDETSFLTALTEKRNAAETDVARTLLQWGEANATRIVWGKGRVDGSFTPIIDHANASHYPFVVYTYGRVELQFQYMTAPPFDAIELRQAFRDKVNKAVDNTVPADSLRRRPSIQLELLANNPDALPVLIDALNWYRSTVFAHTPG